MLIPIQTSGSKPPLFFVHGRRGIMPLGPTFSRVLGPEQPLYVIHASGMDGRRPVIDNFRDLVLAYVEGIQQARPNGAILVGGMCQGGIAALEIVRELQQRGGRVGPPILVDPPAVPGHNRENKRIDPKQPQVARQLYQQVRSYLLEDASKPYNDLPFEIDDPDQLHAATLAGVASVIALARAVPREFSGPVALILSAQTAIGFFHPELLWKQLLPGPRLVHVLPYDHDGLLRSGHEQVARILKFMLEEASDLAPAGGDAASAAA